MCKLILLLFCCWPFFFAQIASLKWRHQHPSTRHLLQINTIQKCCPKNDYTSVPLYCCVDNLFDNGPEFPLQMCDEDGDVEITTIFETISCAQKEFHRQSGDVHSPTDICHNFCCNLLMNVQGPVKETACSQKCAMASFSIGTSVKKQLMDLRRMGCDAAKTHFASPSQFFNDISQSSRSGIGEDAKMMALNEMCRQRAEEQN
ncbi:hypothetical protein niasHT_019923 [Heterodera trifolii]|uniref:Uncharacterized protein n=1 Tax=Heterodera trifolii TaxID=157864 RepID=A0ABD2L8T0_9BILA